MSADDDLTDEDRRRIAIMTKIIVDAFEDAAQRTGIPVSDVAQQVVDELAKMTADCQRLADACAEFESRDDDFPTTD